MVLEILQGIYNAIYSIFSAFLNTITGIIELIWSLLLLVFAFIYAMFTLNLAVIQFFTDFLYPLMATNVYSAVVFSIIIVGVSYVLFRRIWNIIADIELFGWKLPRL